MQIQHNMAAMTASREVGIHSTNFKKSTEKLASGYNINRASDGAAELKISEKMRSQVRGLQRALKNAEEGADFIRVADGAMSETHAILQRMREITVQSLNDTNTPGDRAALAAEFDQLQCEIDRVNEQTDFNRMPVFDKYMPSYYKIEGCRVWTPNQLHTITDPDNDMHIRLPNGQDYVITVPDGTYTTQELMDEIDDAFEYMRPNNPGFTLEFTEDGFCDLIYQKEGGDTEIASVDGYLTYLLFDNYNNNSTISLLGTTQIAPGFPLEIHKGQNDTLIFYAAPNENPYKIVVPPGKYSREQMIDFLNSELKQMNLPGVIAKEYGHGCIQITGGPGTSITGLKGNMFTIEQDSSNIHSVFYDNVCAGNVVNNADSIKGAACYYKDQTAPIKIEKDTVLKYKFNDPDFDPAKDAYDELIIPAGEYIIDPNSTAHNNLYQLLKQLEGTADIKVSVYYNSSRSGYALQIESGVKGSSSSLIFDKGKDQNGISAYELLFEKTQIHRYNDASHYTGYSPTNAYLYGRADLSKPFEVPAGANTLSIQTGSGQIQVTIPPGSYTQSSLIQTLNDHLSADDQTKIEFYASGNALGIRGKNNTITNITVDATGAYKQLLTSVGVTANSFRETSNIGNEEYIQGNTEPVFTPAELVLNQDIPNERTVINSSNNQLNFYLYDAPDTQYISVRIPNSPPNGYTREELINALNDQLKNYPVKAELRGNRLALVTERTGDNAKPYIYVNSQYGNAWSAFLGTQTTTLEPISYNYTKGQPYRFYAKKAISTSSPVDIAAPNNVFNITVGNDTKTITVPPNVYSRGADLAAEIQKAIDQQFPPDPITQEKQITVSYTSRIEMNSPNKFRVSDSDPANEDSFYTKVFQTLTSYSSIGTPVRPNPSTLHIVQDIFIVGRQDIRANDTTIVSGFNDEFVIDLTYPPGTDTDVHTLKVTIPPGTYNGDQIANVLTGLLNDELDKLYPLGREFELKAELGGQNTSVSGSNDNNALSITLIETKDANGNVIDAPSGNYRLDGVRGNASYSIFYKTTGKPIPSYVIGANDLSGGVTFGPDNNTLTLDVDDKNYSFTFPDGYYPPDQLLDMINDLFQQQNCPLTATLENGKLKLSCQVVGAHTITNISGSAKGTLFYQIRSRKDVPPFMLQVGANAYQGLELPRLCVGTVALRMNSLTITRPKYANKALTRLDISINLLSAKRSSYGALQNRLEHIVANNGNAAENAQASESRIRDADMALEMIRYTKHRILTQASEAVLAQAKQLPNIVLNLLQQ